MQPNDARILRGAAIPTAAAGALATAVGAIAAGMAGALGVALGVCLAAAFFAVGLLTLTHVGHRWPDLFFGAALLIYTTQLGALLGMLLLLRDTSLLGGSLGGRAFAAGVLTGTAAWLTGQTRAHLALRVLYVEPVAERAADQGGRP